VDVDACNARGFGVLDFAREVCLARPGCVQLRAKHCSARDTLELLRGLLTLARPHGVQVFANDRPDLAWLSGVDGVHVGQSDLPLSQVRRLAPNLRVGVSTHNQGQMREALAEKPDYVAVGPVFATSSKQDAEACVGIQGLVLAAQLARVAKIPLVAIGGISQTSAREVAKHADRIAVIAALFPESGRLQDVRAQVEAMVSLLAC
jgi:thiamine-phosphate pyrophosphorylase